MRDREGLIARIRHIRRVSAAAESSTAATGSLGDSDLAAAHALEVRIEHLERLVEGLQDSVHRESERQGRLIAELQAQLQPTALRAALSKDARERGL